MTTLAELKSQIWDDLYNQDDLDPATTPQIGRAIALSIAFYNRSKRFYFNESREATFTTVPTQVWYGTTDDADIPGVVKVDGLFLIRAGNQITELDRMDVNQFEWMSDASASRGEPLSYAYYDGKIGVYPVPDKAYTIRITGQIKRVGPTSDTEVGNPWMTEAFELLRCKAKTFLFAHTKQDPQTAAAYKVMEMEELSALLTETTKRVMYDGFTKTEF